MFIDVRCTLPLAPEERHRSHTDAAPPEPGRVMAPLFYKHCAPPERGIYIYTNGARLWSRVFRSALNAKAVLHAVERVDVDPAVGHRKPAPVAP